MILAGVMGFGTGSASAQASRTWVSGVGDDANPCSITAPCKTWAGAISKTAAGGEIDALTPGGFGALTILKAITIDGGGGQIASVLTGGTNGINVNAGPNDVVILRNLSFNGVLGTVTPGLIGLRFLSGAALHVEHCNIMNFSQNGIQVVTGAAAQMNVLDSIITNNAGGGILIQPTSATAKVSIIGTQINGNTTYGLRADGTGGGSVNASFSDSQSIGNSTNGILAISGGGSALVVANRSVLSNNGINGVATSGASATLLVGNSTISGNQNAATVVSGSILTYGNNSVNNNTVSDGTFSGSAPLH
jgi:hypothetical protein